MDIILIRHGKTEGNFNRRFIGKTNESLDEKGIAEIRGYISQGIYPPADMVFASPMKRCLETSSLIYPHIDPIVDDDLKEMDFGKFENLSFDEITSIPGHEGFGMTDESMVFPEGESRLIFNERITRAFRRVVANNCQRAAIIGHNGTIMAIMSCAFNGSYFDFRADNGKGYVIHLSDDRLTYDKL